MNKHTFLARVCNAMLNVLAFLGGGILGCGLLLVSLVWVYARFVYLPEAPTFITLVSLVMAADVIFLALVFFLLVPLANALERQPAAATG